MSIKELRSWRIGGLAIFDIVAAIIGMIMISSYIGISKEKAALLAIPIGILVHYIFGIDTTLNYKLGISNKPIA